jgi:hypothetical protein
MLRLGIQNTGLVYHQEDVDSEGNPKEGASVAAKIYYRDPETEEQLKFNREYMAIAQKKKGEEDTTIGEVLYRFGCDIITGVDDIGVPDDMDPVDALKRWGYHYVVQIATKAFLRGKGTLDLGKSDG